MPNFVSLKPHFCNKMQQIEKDRQFCLSFLMLTPSLFFYLLNNVKFVQFFVVKSNNFLIIVVVASELCKSIAGKARACIYVNCGTIVLNAYNVVNCTTTPPQISCGNSVQNYLVLSEFFKVV